MFEFSQFTLRLYAMLLAIRPVAIISLPVRVQQLRCIAAVPYSALLRYMCLLDHLGRKIVLVNDFQLVGGISADTVALFAVYWRVLVSHRLLLVLPSLRVYFNFALLIVSCEVRVYFLWYFVEAVVTAEGHAEFGVLELESLE